MKDINLIDASASLIWDESEDKICAIGHHQHIPDDFLQSLKESRIESTAPMGDIVLSAQIPTAIVEHWMAQGFNIFDKNVKGSDIVKRLQDEGLEAFLATDRKLF